MPKSVSPTAPAFFSPKAHFKKIVISWNIQYHYYSYHYTRFADDIVSLITYLIYNIPVLVFEVRVLDQKNVEHRYILFDTEFEIIWS